MMTDPKRRLGFSYYAGLWAVLVFCIPGILLAEESGSWTNRAGHALKATPLSITGQLVTFKQDSTGKTVNFPLTIFLPVEQERLRSYLKDMTLPEGLKAAHDFSIRAIKRSRLLKANGSMSENDFQQALATTISAFRTQAAPFVAQQQLSPERMELMALELGADKEQ